MSIVASRFFAGSSQFRQWRQCWQSHRRRNLRPALPVVFAAITLAALVSRPVQAQSFYTVGDSGQFGILNAATGAYTKIGTFSTTIWGIAYGSDGTLYAQAIVGNSDGTDSIQLDRVNTSDATLTSVGTTFASAGNGYFTTTLCASPSGTLYEYLANGASSPSQLFPSLYSINTATGAATLIGGPSGTALDGAFACDGSGNLYASGGDVSSSFLKILAGTGATTVVNSNAGYGTTYSFAFSGTNLYAFGTGGGIYTVNTSNGVATSTGKTYSTSSAGVVAAAVAVPVASAPEPGSCALLVVGLASGVFGGGVISGTLRKCRKEHLVA